MSNLHDSAAGAIVRLNKTISALELLRTDLQEATKLLSDGFKEPRWDTTKASQVGLDVLLFMCDMNKKTYARKLRLLGYNNGYVYLECLGQFCNSVRSEALEIVTFDTEEKARLWCAEMGLVITP